MSAVIHSAAVTLVSMTAHGGTRRGRDRALSPPPSARSWDMRTAMWRSPLIGLRRGVVVAGLLAGLLGMHGFGVEHGMPRPFGDAAVMAVTSDASDRGVALGHVVASVAASAHLAGIQGGHSAPDPHVDMGQACLAVLAAVALVLLLFGPARMRRAAEVLAALPRRWATYQGLAPPRPPDLHLLCVLRT
jgi:hypothetical protein